MKNKISFLEILIIVISVLVLVGVTVSQFKLAAARSRDIDRKNSLNELGQTIKLYYADYGVLPDVKLINSLWGKEWKDGDYIYLNKLPQENRVGKKYCYLVENEGKNFSLLADLENKFDDECQDDKWFCGGDKYCYKHFLESETVK